MFDYEDALDRLTGGDVVRVPGHHRGAGEYDGLLQLSRRSLRQLYGGGWLSRRGLPLDVLASQAGMSCDDFLTEYVRLVARERRSARYRRCYRRRAARAVQAGFPSFWHYRKAQQWTTNP